jgi:spore germination protein YaaH
VVYAPDARSVHRRAMLAYRNDFHGVALWALGNDDDATWDALGAAQRGEPTWPAVAVDTTTAGT